MKALSLVASFTALSASIPVEARQSAGSLLPVGGWNNIASGEFRSISGSPYGNAVGIDPEGRLHAWGAETGTQNVPPGSGFRRAAVGQAFGIAIASDGALVHWGDSSQGQNMIPSGQFREITCGDWDAAAIRSNGSLVAWGSNAWASQAVPQGNDFQSVASGNWHHLAIRSSGRVVAWGFNQTGACDVPAGLVASRVAAGWQFSFALGRDGNVVWWGTDGQGAMSGAPNDGGLVDIAFNVIHGLGGGIGLRADGRIVRWPVAFPVPDTFARAIGTGYVIRDADCNSDGVGDHLQCRGGNLRDFNANSIPDCCEEGTQCIPGVFPTQWRESDGGNGHWYQAIAQPCATWASSLGAARAAGGELASIGSDAENDFVFRASLPIWSANGGGPWLGGFQDPQAPDFVEPSGGWRWSSGEQWAYSSWACTNPSNTGAGEDFLNFAINASCGPRRFPAWNDAADQCNVGFMLEWAADCNDDGIVDKGQILCGQLQDSNADGVPDSCQQPTCRDADLFPDRNVNGADLGLLLSQWGTPTGYTVSDLNRDGAVDGIDLGLLLSFWGPCPY